jgi:hypothetical protein
VAAALRRGGFASGLSWSTVGFMLPPSDIYLQL